MNLSLRKRIQIAPGMYANIGMNGVSISIKSKKGISMNVSNKGTYMNTSIAGMRKRVKIK